MRKLRVGVLGAGGRMGHEISRLLNEHEGLSAYVGVDSKAITFGFTHTHKDFASKKIKETDVWIDFSSPKALMELLPHAIENKTPVVVGTTGLDKKQIAALVSAAKKIPIMWSSNMSMGIAAVNEIIKMLAYVNNFDFQIEEVHHNKKKDKPSGTAIMLNQTMEKALDRKLPAPLSIRGGGVYGIHKLWAMSENEIITVEHTALNRTGFAKGAIQSALWIYSQKPGLYTIRDVLIGK